MDKGNNSQDQMKMFLVFMVVVLVAVVGYLVYNGYSSDVDEVVTDTNSTETDNDSQNTDNTSDITSDRIGDSASDTTNDDATNDSLDRSDDADNDIDHTESTVPSGWVAVENNTYDYTAYKPSNYYYRFFGSESVLGIDPNQLPEASSYVGAVSMQTLDGNLETAKNQYIDPFMAIAQDTKTTKNGTWDLIMAEIPEDEMFPAQNVMCAFIEVDGQVFVVDYRYDSAGDAMYETVFDQFYQAIEFNK